MSFKTVVVFDPSRTPPDFVGKVRQLGAECELKDSRTEDERIAACRDVDLVITGLRLYPFTRKVLENLGRCRYVMTIGVGHSDVDLTAATENGIAILNNASLCDEELSDTAMAFILARARWIIGQQDRLRAGNPVPTASFEVFRNMTVLRGKVLGLVGLGRNGRAMVPKAQGFGMKVIAHDPFVDKSVAENLKVELVDFERVLKESDYLSLHVHLTSETKEMMGLKQFKMMKRSANIINIARGPLINEADLVTALREGFIAGAALDVTNPDPPAKDSPLLKFDNVILTGHNAGLSDQAENKMWGFPLEQISRILRQEWPLSVCNPEVKEKFIAKWGHV